MTENLTDNYPAATAYRVIWRWTTKPTWHDRGFYSTVAEADAAVVKILAAKGAGVETQTLEYTHKRKGGK